MLRFYSDGDLRINYVDYGHVAAGAFIRISSDGKFDVGHMYFDANHELKKGKTCYDSEGAFRGFPAYNVFIA